MTEIEEKEAKECHVCGKVSSETAGWNGTLDNMYVCSDCQDLQDTEQEIPDIDCEMKGYIQHLFNFVVQNKRELENLKREVFNIRCDILNDDEEVD